MTPSEKPSEEERCETCDVDELVSKLGSLPYVRDVLEDPEHAAENMPGAKLAATLYMTVELMEWAVDTRSELARLRADLERVTTERDDLGQALFNLIAHIERGQHAPRVGPVNCDTIEEARHVLAATAKKGGDRT